MYAGNEAVDGGALRRRLRLALQAETGKTHRALHRRLKTTGPAPAVSVYQCKVAQSRSPLGKLTPANSLVAPTNWGLIGPKHSES